MTHGSLFSGIGGFDLAAEWAGWENIFHCEIEEFPRRVLNYYWPNADSLKDIKTESFKKYANKIDILTGGFPCQSFSVAGKRKGKKDNRYLWPEMFRVIQDVQPKYVVAENVTGLISSEGGLVFEQVCSDLENEGYEVQPIVLPACAKNAPHRRDRVWFIAYSKSKQSQWSRFKQSEISREKQREFGGSNSKTSGERTIANTNMFGDNSNQRAEGDKMERKQSKSTMPDRNGRSSKDCRLNDERASSNTKCFGYSRKEYGEEESRFNPKANKGNGWENFPTESPICRGDDGLSKRLVDITFPKWRNESIKAFGNAIVPQIAHEIFKVINIIENESRNN